MRNKFCAPADSSSSRDCAKRSDNNIFCKFYTAINKGCRVDFWGCHKCAPLYFFMGSKANLNQKDPIEKSRFSETILASQSRRAPRAWSSFTSISKLFGGCIIFLNLKD